MLDGETGAPFPPPGCSTLKVNIHLPDCFVVSSVWERGQGSDIVS